MPARKKTKVVGRSPAKAKRPSRPVKKAARPAAKKKPGKLAARAKVGNAPARKSKSPVKKSLPKKVARSVKKVSATKAAPSQTPREAKGILRKELRPKIEAVRGKAQKSAAMVEAIIGHVAWRKASIVAIFAPLDTEPDVELIWAHAQGKVICYPLMRLGGLDFVSVTSPDSLVIGPWGVREPVLDQSRVIPPADIDVMLVPGFAFTKEGHRMGRGGGFYDRLLATPGMRAWKVGTAFHCQLLKRIPVEPHDRRMHRVVTEKGFVPKPAREL